MLHSAEVVVKFGTICDWCPGLDIAALSSEGGGVISNHWGRREIFGGIKVFEIAVAEELVISRDRSHLRLAVGLELYAGHYESSDQDSDERQKTEPRGQGDVEDEFFFVTCAKSRIRIVRKSKIGK